MAAPLEARPARQGRAAIRRFHTSSLLQTRALEGERWAARRSSPIRQPGPHSPNPTAPTARARAPSTSQPIRDKGPARPTIRRDRAPLDAFTVAARRRREQQPHGTNPRSSITMSERASRSGVASSNGLGRDHLDRDSASRRSSADPPIAAGQERHGHDRNVRSHGAKRPRGHFASGASHVEREMIAGVVACGLLP